MFKLRLSSDKKEIFNEFAEAAKDVLYDWKHKPVIRVYNDGFVLEQPYWFRSRKHNIDENFIIKVECDNTSIRVRVNGLHANESYYTASDREEFKKVFSRVMIQVYDFILANFGNPLVRNKNLVDSLFDELLEQLTYPKYPKVIRENTRNLLDDWKVTHSEKDGIYTIEDSMLFDIEKIGVPQFTFGLRIDLDNMTAEAYTELKDVSEETIKRIGFKPYIKKGIKVPTYSQAFIEMYISERVDAIKKSFH